MTTIYERLVAYYEQQNVTPLTLGQKATIGKLIARVWYSSDNAKKDFVHKVYSPENDGSFKVLSYPDSFIPTIDKLIEEWYFPPVKKVRNRKPIKPQPEISVKPTKPM